MDLPVSSFVYHSSLLTVKSVDFFGRHMMASFHNGNPPYLSVVVFCKRYLTPGSNAPGL